MIPIALFADRHVLAGLHVTVYTLGVSHRDPLTIHLFHSGLDGRDLAGVGATLERAGAGHELVARPLDCVSLLPRELPPLHGNFLTYGRLLLDELLPAARVLYLDVDLLVLCDLTPLADSELGSDPVGAITGGPIGDSLDAPLAAHLGIGLMEPHFNAGVLLFDLDRWRAEGLRRQCWDFAGQHRARLVSHDQSLLNLVLRGRIRRLPARYNRVLPFWEKRAAAPGAVYHFLGNPKPFDGWVGRWHANHAAFDACLRQTAFIRRPGDRCRLDCARLWAIRRSAVHALWRRLMAGIT